MREDGRQLSANHLILKITDNYLKLEVAQTKIESNTNDSAVERNGKCSQSSRLRYNMELSHLTFNVGFISARRLLTLLSLKISNIRGRDCCARSGDVSHL